MIDSCLFPNNKPYSSYKNGCRCPRCIQYCKIQRKKYLNKYKINDKNRDIADTSCRFPNNSFSTSYGKGCRCPRCKNQKHAIGNTWVNSSNPLVLKKYYCISHKKYRTENPEKESIRKKKWRKANYDKTSASSRKQYKDNPHKLITSNIVRTYGKHLTPTLTLTENDEMREIYIKCREISESSGVKHHVDHIIPLSKGGLHHPNNLQILTAVENSKKGDKIL